jgi:hypothetical protein
MIGIGFREGVLEDLERGGGWGAVDSLRRSICVRPFLKPSTLKNSAMSILQTL